MREDASRATLSRIAAEAGVSRQALYLHFEGRAGLLLAMVRWVDEKEHFAERVMRFAKCDDPARQLEGYVRMWLDYLPELHPVPGVLARAKADHEAKSAWEDRMAALEGLYRRALRRMRRNGVLRSDFTVSTAVDAVRAIASVHAWEHLAHDRGWAQHRVVDTLWNAVAGAILCSSSGE